MSKKNLDEKSLKQTGAADGRGRLGDAFTEEAYDSLDAQSKTAVNQLGDGQSQQIGGFMFRRDLNGVVRAILG